MPKTYLPSPSRSNVCGSIQKLSDDTAGDCDFCRVDQFTAADTFGRIENVFAVSGAHLGWRTWCYPTLTRDAHYSLFLAANTFKYEGLHSLILFKGHHPTQWGEPEFNGVMDVALRWFQKAYAVGPQFPFPHLMWDLLPKASASQVHPHLQASLGPFRCAPTEFNLVLRVPA